MILATLEDKNKLKFFSDKSSEWLLTYIRAYSEKSIFSDWAFIFNEDAILDWYEKQKIGKIIRKGFNNKETLCLMKEMKIDRYILKKTNKEYNYNFNSENLKYIFENEMYVILALQNHNLNCI